MQTLYLELLSYFEESLDKASSTKANILRDTKDFLNFVSDSEICQQVFFDYIDKLESNYPSSTIVSKLSSLRRFFSWLDLDPNPFWNYKYLPKENCKYYSQDFLEKIFAQSLIIRVIYELAAELKEVTVLNLENFNQANSTISMKEKIIKINPDLLQAIKFYIQRERQEITGNISDIASDPLFVSNKSKTRYLSSELVQLCAKYKIKSYLIKRSRIIHLLQANLDPEKILQINIGDFYDKFRAKQDYRLLNAYHRFHPRASA